MRTNHFENLETFESLNCESRLSLVLLFRSLSPVVHFSLAQKFLGTFTTHSLLWTVQSFSLHSEHVPDFWLTKLTDAPPVYAASFPFPFPTTLENFNFYSDNLCCGLLVIIQSITSKKSRFVYIDQLLKFHCDFDLPSTFATYLPYLT